MLLALVLGVFLVLIAVTAAALAVVVGAHFSSAIMGSTVAHDRTLAGLWADENLDAGVPDPATLAAAERTRLEQGLVRLATRAGILRLEVRDAHGTLVAGSAPDSQSAIGDTVDLAQAATGSSVAHIWASGQDPVIGAVYDGPVIYELLPLMKNDGETGAVVGVWRDGRALLAELDQTRTDVLIVVSVAAVVLAVVLTFVFRAAHRRLARQGAALLESTRRDPLTGMLNHGASVAALAERLELARAAGATLTIALVDVDNFRLFNDTHGHDAGDAVLREVGELINVETGSGCITGRYGPDEFIIVGPPMATEAVDWAVARVRQRLHEVEMGFAGSDPVPVSVSAGVATYPNAARGVTDLLLAVATAAADARQSGGDAVRTAGLIDVQPDHHPTFNALQGLVFAIDTKDRYTKRHSEDVARTAVFLGRKMGLRDLQLEQLRVAGLLHDVGKVAIPDAILRKPGALTVEERLILQQHVALGDLIVRDLPDIAVVRAGVRAHHERWDGSGYLDRLAGDQIPLIARVLAVCDAFSAMTTSRPYRKAISVSEALKRLGDAAGSQLDERIVRLFVSEMDTAIDAPRPDDEAPRMRLWRPSQVTAD